METNVEKCECENMEKRQNHKFCKVKKNAN